MTKKIFKYFSGDVLPLVFQREGFCGVKCSLPKDYNDPYELFLGVDLSVSPELLATYRDIIQDLPQHPTTCFSKSPTVTPMWAHYANNHSGFVLEFDAEELGGIFKNAPIRDVDYKDSPDKNIEGNLQRAAGTKKPRHAIWLQQAVLSEAYFSKHTTWSYEQECRLVAHKNDCEDIAGNQILFIPNRCISSIIVGKKISIKDNEISIEIAKSNNINRYVSVIGKSQAQPFFKNDAGETYIFDGERIVPADNTCEKCSEPTSSDQKLCPWCSITDTHAISAARGNPLRILDRYGLLENYYKETENIGRNRKK